MLWFSIVVMCFLVFRYHQTPNELWFVILGLAYVGDSIMAIHKLISKFLINYLSTLVDALEKQDETARNDSICEKH